MAMSGGRARGGTFADINVTPMADIMIVLLIIFMVMTPLLSTHDGVRLPEARRATRPPAPNGDNTVSIRRDGSLRLGDQVLDSVDQVVTVLQAHAASVVYVEADADAAYGDVERLLDACRAAELRDIAFVTERPRDAPR